MRHFRRRRNTNDDSSVSSQLMGLSLFIMLLAFFIVLNAISNSNTHKEKMVLDSIGGTFGSKIVGSDVRPSMTPSDEESINEGDTLDKLEALFNNHLTGIEITQEKRWGTMHIRTPASSFIQAVMSLQEGALKEEGAALTDDPFVPTLVSLMQTGEQARTYRMDVVLSTPDDPGEMQNDNPGGLRPSLEQLGAVALKLESAGLSKPQMSVGLHKGPPDTVDLYFRPYESFSPVEANEKAEPAENVGGAR